MRCTPKSIVGAAALSSHRSHGGSPQRLGSAGLGLAGLGSAGLVLTGRELAGLGSAAALLPRRGEGHNAAGPSSRRLPLQADGGAERRVNPGAARRSGAAALQP